MSVVINPALNDSIHGLHFTQNAKFFYLYSTIIAGGTKEHRVGFCDKY